MDLDDLKSDYQNMENEGSKSLEDFRKMKKPGRHPILKGIRRQLIFESTAWIFIVIVYYDFFDGHLKSVLWNILLVVSIALVLIHNILGYRIVKTPIRSHNLKDSLGSYLTRIKKYARVSIASRILAVSIFMGFLTSTSNAAGNTYYMVVGGFVLLIMIQYYLLHHIWQKRVKHIKNSIEAFNF